MKTTLTTIIILLIFATPTSAGPKEDEFFKWLADKSNRSEVYYLRQNTVFFNTREKAIKILNRIMSRGGNYTCRQVKRWGANSCLQSWTLGRVVETVPGSDFVKMQYRYPYASGVVGSGWVYTGQIQKADDYKKSLLK